MLFVLSQCALVLVTIGNVNGNRWRWPDDAETSESVRIDSKVGFTDGNLQRNTKRDNRNNVQADELPFQQPTDTEGFYNRPPGDGRYPVRVERERNYDKEIRINGRPAYIANENTRNQKYQAESSIDSLQYCKCVSTPDCKVQNEYSNACGPNLYLCCYQVPGKQNGLQSEYFNEVDDERPMLFPGQSNIAGPFPSPSAENNGVFGPGHAHDNTFIGNIDRRPQFQPAVLVGPGGPTGIIGVSKNQVLVGPNGPTGVVGPEKPVLVGPEGPTGIIGPAHNQQDKNLFVRPLEGTGDVGLSETAQRGVLVGPGGPTGIIGPAYNRPVLVGPGGPTGIIGPRRQSVLVGPGGPTGFIGPGGFNRPSQGPGILVGPGGPTGIIGPGRHILVGPGGPTGRIGPRNYFGK